MASVPLYRISNCCRLW